MATVKRFEELEVWQKSMDLCKVVYDITNVASFNKDFALRDQIRKSAISVPSNISEGFERDSINQFLYFLVIAKGSCGELRTQLNIALHLEYITREQFDDMQESCIQISKQIAGFINYLKSKKNQIIKN